MSDRKTLRDGEPCKHRGCLSHLSHPCDGCGRIGGVSPKPSKDAIEQANRVHEEHFDGLNGGRTVIALAHAIDKARAEGVMKGRESMREEAANRFTGIHYPLTVGQVKAYIRSLPIETTTVKPPP